MYQQIISVIENHSKNKAIEYHADKEHKTIITSRSYGEVLLESQEFSRIFQQQNWPKDNNVLVGIHCDAYHPPICLLTVILCLLKHKVAFILLDGNAVATSNHKIVQLFAIITCKTHSNCTNSTKFMLKTTLGCEYTIEFLHIIQKADAYKDICYVITTSGTTGEPKVVKVTENAIYINVVALSKLFEVSEQDVIYFGTPVTFDPVYVELFLALCTGASLLCTSRRIRADSLRLFEILSARVNIIQMCPSVFLQFTGEQVEYFVNRLRILALGGEPFPPRVCPMKKCRVFNLYGITEVSCWASVKELHDGYKSNNCLGDPIGHTYFQLEIDGTLRDISDCNNCEGILYIGSDVRRCFVNDEQFEADDRVVYRNSGDIVQVTNGQIYYKGRADHLIKRFGTRISLIAIETSIYECTEIVNICVFPRLPFSTGKLVCFLKIPYSQSTFEWKQKTIEKINRQLLTNISSAYLPDYYEILENLPIKLTSGKVDGKQLHEQAVELISTTVDSSRPPYEILQMLFYKYLPLCDGQSLANTFWESGGNSINAMQLAEEYRNLSGGTSFNRQLLDIPMQNAIEIVRNENNKLTVSQEKKTGSDGVLRLIWKRDLKACVDSSPTLYNSERLKYVAVGNYAHTFAVYNAQSGSIYDQIQLANIIESSVLAFGKDNDTVVFCIPCFDGILYCYHLTGSRLVEQWQFATGDSLKQTPILYQNSIIFSSYDHYIYAISHSGELQWKTCLNQSSRAGMFAHNGKLYAAGIKGRIACIVAETGVFRFVYDAQISIFASPALRIDVGDVLFMDIKGCFYSFSLITDQLLWKCDFQLTKSDFFLQDFTLQHANNTIYVGSNKGGLNVIRVDDSKLTHCHSLSLIDVFSNKLLKSEQDCTISAKPLCLSFGDGDFLLVVLTCGLLVLYKILLDNQLKVMDTYPLPDKCFSSPVNDGNRIYIGCRDNHIYCIEVNIG